MDYDTTELVDAILAGRDIFIQLNHGSYPIRIYASLVQCAYAGDTLEDAVKAMADKQGKNDVTLIITAYAGMAPLTIIMNWNE